MNILPRASLLFWISRLMSSNQGQKPTYIYIYIYICVCVHVIIKLTNKITLMPYLKLSIYITC